MMTIKDLLLKLLLTDDRTAAKLCYEHPNQIIMTDNFWFTVIGKQYEYLIRYDNSNVYTHNTLIVRPKDWKQRDKKGQTFLCTREYHISKKIDEDKNFSNRDVVKAIVNHLIEQNHESEDINNG